MVILHKVNKKGIRVSSSGIVFKEIKGSKNLKPGERITQLENKYGKKNIEVTKKDNRLSFFLRTNQKAVFTK